MRFNRISCLVAGVLVTANGVAASTWFGKAVYNKWHETELERWLSDHDIPYPTPADRKDLENLVKDNWNAQVAQPYNSWDVNQLQKYLSTKGADTQKSAVKQKDSLVNSVKSYFTETEEQASESMGNVRDWIFSSWSDSQIKAFLDRHGIPNPQPRTRDSLLKTARENYQSIANKVGQTASYPGDWLYENWSESDLKAWCDERGIPVPQPTSRDRLIATVRRNSRTASQQLNSNYSSLSASAASATQSLSDALFDSWSDSQLKKWADENGLKVPQGSRRNELIALARKHRANLAASGSSVSASASSGFHAATTSAGNEYAKATAGAADTWWEYINWAKAKAGFAASDASASGSSAYSVASASASSLSSSLSSKASSASASAYSKAVKAGSKTKEASKSGAAAASSISKASSKAVEAAIKATSALKQEL